jgi:hypothetical protein
MWHTVTATTNENEERLQFFFRRKDTGSSLMKVGGSEIPIRNIAHTQWK